MAFKGVWTQELWRCVGAEFFGTLVFVLLSLGSTVQWGGNGEEPHPPDRLLVSLCFGLTLATTVQSFSHISGAHVNPAVTAAMLVTGKVSVSKAVFYLLAQSGGAVAGAAILYGVTPSSVRGGLGVATVNESVSVGSALLVELVISFQLVFTVFAACDHKRTKLKGSSALAVGLSASSGHLFAVPYTGAGMNPARCFGPAAVTWFWDEHWVYWLGPMLGGVLAAVLYEYLFGPQAEPKKRFSDAFVTTPFSASLRRHDSVTAQEPLFTVMDADRKDTPPEVLTTV